MGKLRMIEARLKLLFVWAAFRLVVRSPKAKDDSQVAISSPGYL